MGGRSYPVPGGVRGAATRALRDDDLELSPNHLRLVRRLASGRINESGVRSLRMHLEPAGLAMLASASEAPVYEAMGGRPAEEWAERVCDSIDRRRERALAACGYCDDCGQGYYGLLDPDDNDVVTALMRLDAETGTLSTWRGSAWEDVPDEYDPIGAPYAELTPDLVAELVEALSNGSSGLVMRPTSPRAWLTAAAAAAVGPAPDSVEGVYAVVDDFDTTAVLEVIMVLPGPKAYRRNGGQWTEDRQVLADLKSVDPPAVVPVDPGQVPALVAQVDDYDAQHPQPVVTAAAFDESKFKRDATGKFSTKEEKKEKERERVGKNGRPAATPKNMARYVRKGGPRPVGVKRSPEAIKRAEERKKKLAAKKAAKKLAAKSTPLSSRAPGEVADPKDVTTATPAKMTPARRPKPDKPKPKPRRNQMRPEPNKGGGEGARPRPQKRQPAKKTVRRQLSQIRDQLSEMQDAIEESQQQRPESSASTSPPTRPGTKPIYNKPPRPAPTPAPTVGPDLSAPGGAKGEWPQEWGPEPLETTPSGSPRLFGYEDGSAIYEDGTRYDPETGLYTARDGSTYSAPGAEPVGETKPAYDKPPPSPSPATPPAGETKPSYDKPPPGVPPRDTKPPVPTDSAPEDAPEMDRRTQFEIDQAKAQQLERRHRAKFETDIRQRFELLMRRGLTERDARDKIANLVAAESFRRRKWDSDFTDRVETEQIRRMEYDAGRVRPVRAAGAEKPATSRMPNDLEAYWAKGKGAAKIRWGTGGDFDRCRRALAKYLRPDQVSGACANLHRVATGTWPGKGKKHKPGTKRAVAAAAYSGGGSMVAMFLPPEAASQVALFDGNPPDDLHITLAYLGEVEPEVVASAAQVARTVASEFPALEGELNGLGIFTPSEQPMDGSPVWVSADVPGLADFRSALVTALKAAGVPVQEDHGFTPHVTLTYSDDPESAMSRADLDLPIRVGFDTVTTCSGRERIHSPLAGLKY